MEEQKSVTANFDSPWKEILDLFLPEFMKLFFSDVYQDIDWSKGFEPLEQELREIGCGEESHKNFTDKLVKVYRKGGEERLVFVHIECQAQQDKELPKRIYLYHCRLVSKQKSPLMNLAVLGDGNPNWRPEEYAGEIWGSKFNLSYPVVKLLDYKDRIDELKASCNPFAYFVIAHLKTLETNRNVPQRLQYKQEIIQELLDLGLAEKTAVDLIRFIDALMTLPKEDERKFIQAIHAYQEEKQMPFLAPFEILAMEDGLEQGKEVGLKEGLFIGRQEGGLEEARIALLDILEEEFGAVPASMKDSIQGLQDLDGIRRLRRQALKAASLEEFQRILFELT